ncbi:MAG: hypothetical protein ACLSVX_01885 [Massilimicrobiota timonensis]
MAQSIFDEELMKILQTFNEDKDIDIEEYKRLDKYMKGSYKKNNIFKMHDNDTEAHSSNRIEKLLTKLNNENNSYENEIAKFEKEREKLRYSDNYSSLWPEEDEDYYKNHTFPSHDCNYYIDIDFKKRIIFIELPYGYQKIGYIDNNKINDVYETIEEFLSLVTPLDLARLYINIPKRFYRIKTKLGDTEEFYDWLDEKTWGNDFYEWKDIINEITDVFDDYVLPILYCCSNSKTIMEEMSLYFTSYEILESITNSTEEKIKFIQRILLMEKKLNTLEQILIEKEKNLQ